MRIIQISDTHLYADASGELLGINTRDSFNAVIQLIVKSELQFDIIILTGDLSHDGSAKSYQYIAAALQIFPKPIYWLPGNHDDVVMMADTFGSTQLLADKEIHDENWSLLLLNSVDSGRVPGYIDDAERDKLESFIKNNQVKANLMILLHHQPIPVGSVWLDGVGLRNAEELRSVIATAHNLRAVIFGHVHQEFDQLDHGIRYIASPATSIQFLPKSSAFALDHLTPGFRYLELYPDGTINTKVQRLNHFSAKIDYASKGY